MTLQKKFGMLHDSNKCIGCQSCSIACRAENRVPNGVYRLQVWITGPRGEHPNLAMDFHRQSCVMCENPPCVPVCPTGASYINEQGVVLVDQEKCVGCKYCIAACPYNARFTDPVTGAASKCTFCWEGRVGKDKGEQPACVSICPTNAIIFGDLNDPKSELRTAMAHNHLTVLKEHLATRPKLFIIPNPGGDK